MISLCSPPHPASFLLLQQNVRELWIPTGKLSPKTPRWISLCPLFLSYNNPPSGPSSAEDSEKGKWAVLPWDTQGSRTFLKVLLRPRLSPGQDGRDQGRPCLMLHNSSIPTGRFYTWEATGHRRDTPIPNGYNYSHSVHALHLNLKLLPSALFQASNFFFLFGFNSYILYY